MARIQLYPANRSGVEDVKEIGEMLESIHEGMKDKGSAFFVLLDAPKTEPWNQVLGAIDTYSEQMIDALAKQTLFPEWASGIFSMLAGLKRRHEIEIRPISIGNERREDLELLNDSYKNEARLKGKLDNATEEKERASIRNEMMFERTVINGIQKQAMIDNIRDIADGNKDTPIFVIADGEYADFIQRSLAYDKYDAELAKPLDALLEKFLAVKFVRMSEALGLPRIMAGLAADDAIRDQHTKKEVDTGTISLRSERIPEPGKDAAIQEEQRAGASEKTHSKKGTHRSRS
jgi:hypothetical protein